MFVSIHCFFVYLIMAILAEVRWNSVVLIVFLSWLTMLQFFHIFIGGFCFFFGEAPFNSLDHFCGVFESLYITDINSLLEEWIAGNDLLSGCKLSFHSGDCFFHCAEIFNSLESHLLILVIISGASGALFRKFFPFTMSQRTSPMLSSSSFSYGSYT